VYQNTDLKHFVRIGICYYSLTRHHSPKLYEKLYVRLGPTVIVMYHSREVPQHRMLRVMLIALLRYHTFILNARRFDLDPSIPRDMRKIVSFVNRPVFQKFEKYSLSVLMELIVPLMVKLSTSNLHGRINFQYSPDSLQVFARIHVQMMNVISF
jgi:hypothetical protein